MVRKRYIESFFSAFKRWFGEYVIWYNKHADDGWDSVGGLYGGIDENRGVLGSGRL